jgi:hypothetical protein
MKCAISANIAIRNNPIQSRKLVVSFGDSISFLFTGHFPFLDLTTPSGRLMFQIIGAMAEFERALIQERVRAGLRNARAKGKRLGRPPVFVSAATCDDTIPFHSISNLNTIQKPERNMDAFE